MNLTNLDFFFLFPCAVSQIKKRKIPYILVTRLLQRDIKGTIQLEFEAFFTVMYKKKDQEAFFILKHGINLKISSCDAI